MIKLNNLQKQSNKLIVFLECDIQESFILNIKQKEILLKNALLISKFANNMNIPLIASKQQEKVFGNTSTELLEFRESQENDLIKLNQNKMKFSMQTDELIDILSEVDKDENKYNNKDRVFILYGCETHICVLQTVRDLISEGQKVIILEDCVSSIRSSDRQIGLKRIYQMGAIPSSTQQMMYEIIGDASDPLFKKNLGLFKELNNIDTNLLINNL